MTELEPSGSQPFDLSIHKQFTDDERTGNEKNGDQLSGNQPSSNQPNSDQPTDDQPMGDQPTDGQPMDDQPTDNNSTDAIYTAVSLIDEVQKRPCIFNEDFNEYCKQHIRRQEWEKVCEGLCPQLSTFSPSKKKEISRQIQNNWTKMRESFFKCYRGIHKRLIQNRSFGSHNSLFRVVAGCGPIHGLDEIIAERNDEEENARKDQNASYNHEEYARSEQNASCEEEYVHGMNPFLEMIRAAEIPEILKQPVPSVSDLVVPMEAVLSTCAQFNENQGHIPEMQTTSAHNNQGQNDLPSRGQTIKNASVLCAMLDNLDYDQQCAVWPKLIALLNNASKSKPKKIKILQGELLNPGDCGATLMPATGPEIILQEPFTDPELEGQEPFAGPELVAEEPFADPELVVREPFADLGLVAQEPFADPELGNQQTLAEKRVDQETMTEWDDTEEEEYIYPSSHGRPTNAQGEIIYPETDHEDLDED